jgi:hypothetical protein
MLGVSFNFYKRKKEGMYRRCGKRKILTSASLREAVNTDLDLWLPKCRKAVAATLSARLRDPSVEIALALGDGEGQRGARRAV